MLRTLEDQKNLLQLVGTAHKYGIDPDDDIWWNPGFVSLVSEEAFNAFWVAKQGWLEGKHPGLASRVKTKKQWLDFLEMQEEGPGSSAPRKFSYVRAFLLGEESNSEESDGCV